MNEPDALIAGRYRLVDRIGTGGMGVVWKAWDERLQRPVAVKQLRPYRGLSETDARVANDRAMREARITARLHHPHAVPVFDVAEHDGQPCLIMQYLPSRSLEEVLKDSGPLPPSQVARIGAEVGAALAAAHRAGIVHRDVKPGNVLIAEDGSAKISDFGISHAMGDVTLTATGIVTGTPAYLAPEVARGAASSFASDVFSLGSTLYTALEGAPPFGAQENPMALLHQVANGRVTPPSRSGPLTPLLLRMLEPVPDDRPTMAEAAAALGAAASGRSPMATVALPQVGPPDPWPDGPADRRSPRATVALVSAAVLVAMGVLVAALLFPRSGAGGPVAQPGAVPASSPAISANAALPTPPTSSPTVASPASPLTASQLAQAVTDYYGLLPGNTDAGWSRLTPRYQTTTAKNRQTYQAFWDALQRVSVSGTTASPPGAVQATITYFFKDGRVVQERTTFGLVNDGGILKIDSSSVSSSRPQGCSDCRRNGDD